MTTNISNLLDEAWKSLQEVDKDDWYSYLDHPQSINQKFFMGKTNLSLDMFTLTEIYHVLTANFAGVLPKLKLENDNLLLNDIKAVTYSYEGLIEWIETFAESRDLRVKEHYVSKAENLLHVILISDYHCFCKMKK